MIAMRAAISGAGEEAGSADSAVVDCSAAARWRGRRGAKAKEGWWCDLDVGCRMGVGRCAGPPSSGPGWGGRHVGQHRARARRAPPPAPPPPPLRTGCGISARAASRIARGSERLGWRIGTTDQRAAGAARTRRCGYSSGTYRARGRGEKILCRGQARGSRQAEEEHRHRGEPALPVHLGWAHLGVALAAPAAGFPNRFSGS